MANKPKHGSPMVSRLNIPIPDSLKADLQAMQEATGTTLAEITRRALQDAVSKWKAAKQ